MAQTTGKQTSQKRSKVLDLSFQRDVPAPINSCDGYPKTSHQDPKTKTIGPVEAYDPTQPWSDYSLDQAAWRISIGVGTEADRAALAAQRRKEENPDEPR